MLSKFPVDLQERFKNIVGTAQTALLFKVVDASSDKRNLAELIIDAYDRVLLCNALEDDSEASMLRQCKVITGGLDEISDFLSMWQNLQDEDEREYTATESINAEKMSVVYAKMLESAIISTSVQPEAKPENKLMKKHVCPVCGSEFESNRKDAKYCSAKCKQAAYRMRKPEATL